MTLKTSQPVEVLISYDSLDEQIRKKFFKASIQDIKEEVELQLRFEMSEEGIVALNRIEEKGSRKEFVLEVFGNLNKD